MDSRDTRHRALVSSDWNECLAPCGPFDVMAFSYPDLTDALQSIFQRYTGNAIALGEAVAQIQKLIPEPISEEMMDAYLDREFKTYTGVSDFITWCGDHDILFMINTTGMTGYFERIFAKKLLPDVPVISAHPMIRYDRQDSGARRILELLEIQDKGKNTEIISRAFDLAGQRIFLIGDSGGDGPHFEWGARHGAVLIGSMTKASLAGYCREKDIRVDHHFGLTYQQGQQRDPEAEMKVDFMGLAEIIRDTLGF
jgi:2-hydroxy-3-keto-5-methylthiopentenyl-1-phosphate phosphatase